jgi:hypothetical protein
MIKHVYVLYGNRELGSRHWYIVGIYKSRKRALKHATGYLKTKWGKNFGYTIDRHTLR